MGWNLHLSSHTHTVLDLWLAGASVGYEDKKMNLARAVWVLLFIVEPDTVGDLQPLHTKTYRKWLSARKDTSFVWSVVIY